jgi:hypothetical protein
MAMTTYKLSDFMNITFSGFNYSVPEDTIKIIHSLAQQVGSPTYIKTPTFQKNTVNTENSFSTNQNTSSNGFAVHTNKKRKGYKHMEVTSDEWDTLRTFQATKIEKKTGIDGQINNLRLLLNKLTDKTFTEIRSQIIEIIETLLTDTVPEEELNIIGLAIFEIASTNKFYSRLYADLYAELIKRYEFLRPVFKKNYDEYLDIFNNIETGDPNSNYDKFCEINKVNEKRKAVSTFFMNLMINGIVTKISIIDIVRKLLETVLVYIEQEDKINEVQELTENIAILFNKEMIEQMLDEPENKSCCMIKENSIIETIVLLAKSKSKNYKSLSNKSIFKYMDLLEM